MPIDPIPKALYPLVPQVAGVPPLLRAGAQLFDTVTLGFFGAGDALSSIIGTGVPTWGILDEAGQPFADWDSFVALRFRAESMISNYPVEKGGFASYNKVEMPFTIQATMSCAGSDARISQFLVDLEAAKKTTNLFSVLTPEFTFESVNIVDYDFSRTQTEGAHMIVATLTCIEVRQTAISDFSSNKNPEADDPKSLGQVQTVDDPTIDVTGIA